MELVVLNFDNLGWWDQGSIAILDKLVLLGNNPGWYGVTNSPESRPFFVPGVMTAEEAVLAGMPAEAAESSQAKYTTPLAMLGGDKWPKRKSH